MKGIVLPALAAGLFLLPGRASAGEAAQTSAVQASTVPYKTRLRQLFDHRLRDPFNPVGGGGGVVRTKKDEGWVYDHEELDVNVLIHALQLKGLMRGGKTHYAVLLDPGIGMGFILRNGKLFDYKDNLIRGVRGRINLEQKTVILTTPDKDVQILRLGESAESEEDEEGET